MISFALLPHFNDTIKILNKYTKHDNIRFFIDLRNALTIFFDENKCKILLKDPKSSIGEVISTIYHSADYIIEIIKNSHFDSNFQLIYFFDEGESSYHKAIYKSYKKNRKTAWAILSEKDVKQVKDINKVSLDIFFETTNKFFDKIKCVKLSHMESDFIPYYIKKYYPKEKCLNVILSNDKDMFQCIDENTICLKKEYKKKKTVEVTQDNMYEILSKKEGLKLNKRKNMIPEILAISGDSSDGIDGVKGISYITAIKLLMPDKINSIDDLLNVNEDVYDKPSLKNKLKHVKENKDKIIRNMKLISYELIEKNISPRTIDLIKGVIEKKRQFKQEQDFKRILLEFNQDINYSNVLNMLENEDDLKGLLGDDNSIPFLFR